MVKTRRNKTRSKKRKNYLKGWSKQQPGTHQRTLMIKSAVKNVF